MIKRKILLTLALGLVGLTAGAQGVLNVRINEVLVSNETNFVDDYGHNNAWIELFNTGYENTNVGGCYLRVRYANPVNATDSVKTYIIPRGDGATKMAPQSYLLFYCEGTDTKGTFYTNFTLHEGEVRSIELLNANGKDVIDTFSLPEDYVPAADISWGWVTDTTTDEIVFGMLDRATPNATNDTAPEVARHEIFRQRDTTGGIMAIIAMSVVMSALILIFLILKLVAIFMQRFEGKIAKLSHDPHANHHEQPKQPKPVKEVVVKSNVSGEIEAAIATAVALALTERHIEESGIITINNTSKLNRR